MRDTLLLYYERELHFIRKLAMEFAEKYPEEAGRLMLESTKSEDPHVERLIESFAMLAARVRLKLDDDFPEVTDALLGLLYPHYLNPLPSMSIAQLSVDPEQGKSEEGVLIDRHALLATRAIDGVRCQFRTAYPTRLWPVEVSESEIVPASAIGASVPADVTAALRLRIRTLDGGGIGEYRLDPLTVFLDADSSSLHKIYELLGLEAIGLHVRRGREGQGRLLSPDHLRPMGLEKDEGLLEYPPESFLGYRLLQEYFCFPDKYLFFELTGLSRATGADAPELEVSILLRKPLSEIDVRPAPGNFKLGCTPIVNLFPMRADPIRIDHSRIEHRVTPDQRALYSYEVYHVTDVSSTSPTSTDRREYAPFYALRHGIAQSSSVPFWVTSRTPSMRRDDPGTDVHLTLVDKDFQPADTDADVLHVRALCTNRDLPARLPFGDAAGDLYLEGRAEVKKIVCLRKPTTPVRAPTREGSRWRIISHLALNYLSLTQGLHESVQQGDAAQQHALNATREILKLYDYQDSAVTRTLIDGLVAIRAKKVLRRLGRGAEAAFARGLEVELELDEEKYTATGAFLFATVLERFLGLYTSINSFTQTVARTRQRGGVLKRWPPRAGEVQVL